VKQVYRFIDPSSVMGLSPEVKDFLVVAYATTSGREILRGGSPLREIVLGKLPDDAELVQPPMPTPAEWECALDTAGKLFGISLGGRARHAKNLRALSERLDAKRKEATAARAHEIEALLIRRQAFFAADTPRLATAHKVADILLRLDVTDAIEKVEVLSTFDPAPSSLSAMQRDIVHASKTAAALDDEVLFNTFAALRGRSEPAAAAILTAVAKVLGTDEILESANVALREKALEAQRLLIVQKPVTDPMPGRKPEVREVLPPPGLVAQGEADSLDGLATEREKIARALEQAGAGAKLSVKWVVIKG
jgi:hypothetical protein